MATDPVATEYDAVVFDNDGVIVEPTPTETLTEAARHAFREVGIADPPDELITHAVEETLDGLATLEDDHGVTLADYWPVRERHAIEYQRRVIEAGDKPLYDDVAAIETLDATLAVVSNNQQQTVDALVERHEISDLFEHVCGREPTLAAMDRRKPDPHLIETTLEAIEASNALYVGDKHSDVVAAARAGIDSAFLRRSHCRDVTLDRTPTYEVETLRELVDELAVSEEQ